MLDLTGDAVDIGMVMSLNVKVVVLVTCCFSCEFVFQFVQRQPGMVWGGNGVRGGWQTKRGGKVMRRGRWGKGEH